MKNSIKNSINLKVIHKSVVVLEDSIQMEKKT